MRRRNEKPPDSSSSTPLNSSPSATPPPKEARLSKEEEKNPVPETRPHSNPFRVNPDSPSSSTTSSTTSMTQTQTQVRFYPDLNKRFKAGILDGTSTGAPISQSIQEDPFSYPNYQDYPMDWGIQQSLLSSFGYLNQGIPPSMLYPQQGVPFQAIPFFDSSSSTMSETAGEDSLDPRIAYSNREESDESPENDPLTASDGLFVLREQPKPKQRKSYKKENRYLLPNPTQIIPGESRKKSPEPSDIIESGICKVSLVDGSGNKLKKETNHYLEDTEGSLVKPFDAELGCFNFTLKIRQNSGPDKFRLCFRVKYKTADGVDHKERIVSNPFLVQSNKSFFSKDPKLKGIHPATGIHDKPNEVWIKGRDFNEKGVVVKVDGIEASILEIQPNLIIALTPVREEMTKSKVVKVSVSNLFKQKMVHSEQHFQFTYLVPTDGMLPRDSVFKRSGSPLVASKENSS